MQTAIVLAYSSSKRAAFGMVMPERAFNAEKYRWGFNGKENDNEVKGFGNSLDFSARIQDSRLGRFLSIDPLSKEYPWNSTFTFAENRVIDGVDYHGEGWGDYLSPIKKLIVAKIKSVAENAIITTIEYVKDELHKVTVTPYIKIEAKYSQGARVAGQINKTVGGDINAGSMEVAKLTIEFNPETIKKPLDIVQANYIGKDGKATFTTGVSGNISASVGGGVTTSYSRLISKDGEIDETKSSSIGASVSIINSTITGERKTNNKTGQTTNSVGGSVGHGGSFGIIGSVDYTIETGVKLSTTTED